MGVYEVIDVLPDNTIRLKKHIGQANLETYEQNSEMVFQIYQENYDEYNYVQVPLEENQYICVFLGTIYNNVRSLLSTPYFVKQGAAVQVEGANGYTAADYDVYVWTPAAAFSDPDAFEVTLK